MMRILGFAGLLASVSMQLAAARSGAAAPSASGGCPEIDPLDITPCKTCTRNNFMDGQQPLCAFCYATRSCVQVTKATIISGESVCPKPATPSAAPSGQSTESVGDSGKEKERSDDYSLGLQKSCDCRPDLWTNCSSCANVQHLGCTWINNATVTREFKIPPLGLSLTRVAQTNGTCMSIISAEVSEYDIASDSDGNVLFSMTEAWKVHDYYWGQCAVSGMGFAAIIIAAALLAAACAAGACLVACCCRRKKRPTHPHYTHLQPSNVITYAAP